MIDRLFQTLSPFRVQLMLYQIPPNLFRSHSQLVDKFRARHNAILPRYRTAVDALTEIKVALRLVGTPIGPNDTDIVWHAIAAGTTLVTNLLDRRAVRSQSVMPEGHKRRYSGVK